MKVSELIQELYVEELFGLFSQTPKKVSYSVSKVNPLILAIEHLNRFKFPVSFLEYGDKPQNPNNRILILTPGQMREMEESASLLLINDKPSRMGGYIHFDNMARVAHFSEEDPSYKLKYKKPKPWDYEYYINFDIYRLKNRTADDVVFMDYVDSNFNYIRHNLGITFLEFYHDVQYVGTSRSKEKEILNKYKRTKKINTSL
jgi:hypothetical protein